jgi:hypothetical protein
MSILIKGKVRNNKYIIYYDKDYFNPDQKMFVSLSMMIHSIFQSSECIEL